MTSTRSARPEIEVEGASVRFLYLLAFVVGLSTLGAEIAAARLIAPYFGASTIIWANTIGVVLVSLSVGYWLGGRVADRHPHLRGLWWIIAAAAVLVAVVPIVAKPIFEVSVGALDQIEAGAFIGSLLGVLLLIAVPVILLGACSPYAVRLAVPDVDHTGSVAGRLSAVSTVGSLLGTMLAALVTIPFLGTRLSFLLFAALLGVVAAIGLGWRYIALPVGIGLLALLPAGQVKAEGPGERVLWDGETELQYARVVAEPDGDRRLELNEGVAQHSVWRPATFVTDNVWDAYITFPFAARDDVPRKVAILGNAAGTVQRTLGHFYPGIEVDGVELDPELTELGERYFDLRLDRNLRVHHADARPWLRGSNGGFDVIMVDAYRQPYIPFYLTTREFFEMARSRLAPGGSVIVNIGHPVGNDELEKVVGRTMAEVFPTVIRNPVNDWSTLLLGTVGPASASRLRKNRDLLPPEFRNLAAIEAVRIGPRLPGGEVYTDDRAPVEWLIDRSIIGYASGDR
ncbi:MAG: spermidine synthase [bacterium]